MKAGKRERKKTSKSIIGKRERRNKRKMKK